MILLSKFDEIFTTFDGLKAAFCDNLMLVILIESVEEVLGASIPWLKLGDDEEEEEEDEGEEGEVEEEEEEEKEEGEKKEVEEEEWGWKDVEISMRKGGVAQQFSRSSSTKENSFVFIFSFSFSFSFFKSLFWSLVFSASSTFLVEIS